MKFCGPCRKKLAAARKRKKTKRSSDLNDVIRRFEKAVKTETHFVIGLRGIGKTFPG